ncbi:MAG: F0F1 ATP synthase subunit B [Deltaproteobacteria bacterium]|nr:F0F1 ATP synthase subunit B [Deltaproteobacteria bacterium]
MKRFTPLFFAVAALVLAAVPAFAAEEGAHGGHGGFPTGQVVATVINFLLFVGLLVYFSKAGVRLYYKKRSETLNEAVQKAEAALTEAKALHEEAAARLAQADDEARRIEDNARQAAEEHRREIIEYAKHQAERILAETEAGLQAETRKMTEELMRELSEHVVEIARKRLEEKADASAQRSLVNDYLSKGGEA